MINKNISVWRGLNTPPTEKHLWLKSGELYYFDNGVWKILINSKEIIKQIESILKDIEDKIDSKLESESPELSGTPTAPTPAEGDVSNLIATTEFVYNIIQKELENDTLATEKDINDMFIL